MPQMPARRGFPSTQDVNLSQSDLETSLALEPALLDALLTLLFTLSGIR